MRFQDLKIDNAILKAIHEIGYDTPTPIQQQAIPIVLQGHDLLGCAQTGTGKTAAFSVPMLQRMGSPVSGEPRPVRGLILTPTRELALQIYENLCQYGRYTGRLATVIFGGVSQNPQVEALRSGVDILVATPGRLWDLMGQKLVDISQVECFVLDEADRMLDMGFIQDVRRIIQFLPKKRQTLLFSATMPDEVANLAKTLLHRPKYISIVPAATPVERIHQGVYFVSDKKAKRELLRSVLEARSLPQTLVFTRTKHGADRVARDLSRAGIQAKSIHGDKSQNARQNALKQFKEYKIAVLVATDIAARGIDISELPLVINFDLPNVPETYVHRIGRTGRAGQAGTALSFCEPSELPYLKEIETLTHMAIPALEPPMEIAIAEAQTAARYVASKQDSSREAGRRRTTEHAKVTKKQVNERKPAHVLEPHKVEIHPKEWSAVSKRSTAQSVQSRNRKHGAERTSGRKENAINPAVFEQGTPIRTAGGRSSSRRREEPETRVDVMTPHTGRPLAPSTAARIRAKVEAKLAERQAAQAKGAAVQARSAKQGKVSRKSKTRSGRGRARG